MEIDSVYLQLVVTVHAPISYTLDIEYVCLQLVVTCPDKLHCEGGG